MRIYRKKRTFYFLLTFFLIQLFLMLINMAWGGGRIDNIRLEREGDYTRITIYGDEPFEFSHSIEVAKNGKPHRLIIDCQDMIFDLPQHDFREGLPEGIIKAIRTSQYQVTPEKIVRVVLDLKGKVAYKVLERISENQAAIAILTAEESDFNQWIAVKENEDNKTNLTTRTPETKKEEPTQTAATPKVETKSVENQQMAENTSPATKATGSVTTQNQALERQSNVFTSSQVKEEGAPSISDRMSHSSVPLGPYWEEATSTSESKRISEFELAKTETGRGTEIADEQKMALGLGKTFERGIGAVLGTEGVSAHESDTLAPEMMTIQNPLQTDLGIVNSRKLITYHPETRRDPFLPLTEREDMQFGEVPLPRFENLKLVGIIRDAGGNQALLEDEIGFGYILRSGDRIKNGYVLSVEENKAVFQVEEYGGYKTMSLELNPEY